MSARIGLKLQGLEKLKRNETRSSAPCILKLFTMNVEFANNFSAEQYSTPDSH
jgi:hypothetical protein